MQIILIHPNEKTQPLGSAWRKGGARGWILHHKRIGKSALSPYVFDLTLFTLFMLLVSNVLNTRDIIQVIPRWRTKMCF